MQAGLLSGELNGELAFPGSVQVAGARSVGIYLQGTFSKEGRSKITFGSGNGVV